MINFFVSFISIIGDWDWGLGIGDWAQSPIPNPQSPITIFYFNNSYNLSFYLLLY